MTDKVGDAFGKPIIRCEHCGACFIDDWSLCFHVQQYHNWAGMSWMN